MSRLGKMTVRQDDTKRMEEETRKMECKMEALRKMMEESSGGAKGDSGSRWKSGAATRPLRRDYVKEVLAAPRATKRPDAMRRPAATSDGQSDSPLSAKRTSAPRPPPAADAGNGGYPPPGANGRTMSPLPPQAPPSGTVLSATGGTSAAGGSPSKSGTAAANLQAALSKQSDESKEVEGLLAELKLDRYAGLFVEHGFDCMEVVLEMQESHMREIGMAAGHALKLQKKISELRGEPTAAAPPPPPARPASDARGPPTVSFGRTETREIPVKEDAGGNLWEGNFDEAESAASFQEALKAWRTGGSSTTAGSSEPAGSQVSGSSTTAPDPSSLLDGPGFDEKESAASFQEALKAWREGGSQGNSAPSKPVGSFWASVGEQDVDLQRASTPLANVPADMCFAAQAGSQVKMAASASEEKLCCYSCYKQFFKRHAVERYDVSAASAEAASTGPRRFCSEPCADRWSTAMEAKAEAARKRHEEKERLRQSILSAEAGLAEAADKAAAAEAELQSVTSTPSAASQLRPADAVAAEAQAVSA